MQKLKRPVSVILSILMVISMLVVVPVTASAAVGDSVSESECLTFTAVEAGSSVTLKVASCDYLQYNKNNSGWQIYTVGTQIALASAGDSVRFRGGNTTFNDDNHVTLTGKVACSGNVMSLRLDDNGKVQGLSERCFYYMFKDCAGLTAAPELPETILAEHCYDRMFSGCTNLTAAPVLPATALADSCYDCMFIGCTSLTTAPVLPATTLARYCYNCMFYGCTSLTTAPVLPATTLEYSCYSNMFSGCESLTTAPELWATELTDYCYSNMFEGCKSLTTAPELPAEELTSYCYSYMFYGCSSIKLSDTKTAEYSKEYRVPSEGTGTTASSYNLYNMFARTGGTFKGTPDINKTYYVPANYVAEINGTGYETLEDAFAAAVDGDTITLLADCAGNGIKAPQGKFTNGLTVDFAGKTYTVDGETVGSTGTETNGFQLLKNNKITFKNGTITSEKAKILVQNYSNLTLEGMTLTLNNPSYAYAYTLSNNNGDVVIDDTTINANPAGGFAFDVCRYASYRSIDVTVTGNSVINGDVEISASNNSALDGFSLTLTSGTMNGDIVVDASAASLIGEDNTVTKASTFTQEAPAGFEWVGEGSTQTLAAIPYVAQIGNTKYEDLQTALNAAQADDEIVVLDNIALTGAHWFVVNKDVTIDLNGKTISSEDSVFVTKNGADLTVKNGTMTSSVANDYAIYVNDGSVFTLEDDATLKATNSRGNGIIVRTGGQADINGTIETGYYSIAGFGTSVVNVNDGASITSTDASAISGNGSGGNEGYTFNVKGGTLTSTNDVAIYHPNQGTLNITGGTITGKTAVYIKSGTTDVSTSSTSISGATIHGTGADTAMVHSGNGCNATGDAIVIENCGYPGGTPSVEISGGTIKSDNADAVASYGYDDGTTEYEPIKEFVSGGSFSNVVPADYCAKGYSPVTIPDSNNMYTVEKTKAVEAYDAQGNLVGAYTSIDAAIEAGGDGCTVKLVADLYEQQQINSQKTPVTLDLNGHMINVEGGAGLNFSMGYYWNGDHIFTVKDTVGTGGINITPKYFGNACISDNTGRTIIVEGGTFTSTGKAIYCTGSNGSITVNGGTFNGDVYVHDTGYGHGELSITGGTVNGTLSTVDNAVLKVSGGVFDAPVPEAYCADGYIPKDNSDGTYGVKQGSYVAQIGDNKYETLEAAFAAAQDGDTITVLADSTGNGIKAPQGKFGTNGLTVDFGGHKYTVDANTVGSTGTETQGFQLLKGNKITFQNGAITGDTSATNSLLFLIQNYSDLTLDKMNLSLKGQYYGQYTLSNNNGEIVINDSTINAPDYTWINPSIKPSDVNSFAFDVCRYSSYPSVNVTVTGDSVINGDVEISASKSDAKDGFSLTLESGTLNGNIVLDKTAAAAMESAPNKTEVTKADTFTQAAPAGYEWVSNGDGTSTLKVQLFTGHSINLGGDIGVNFFINSRYPALKSANSAKVRFTWDDEYTAEVDLKTLTPDATTGYYKATVDVVAAHMNHPIRAEIFVNGTKLPGENEKDEFTVKAYADELYAHPEKYVEANKTVKLQNLAKALLNYGSEAQTVFVDSLNDKQPARADSEVGTTDYSDITSADVREAINGQYTENLKKFATDELGNQYFTNSLIYLSKNTLRIYFIPPEGKSTMPNSGAYDGHKLDYYYYVQKTNIAAAELDNVQTFNIAGKSFSYSPLNYVADVLDTTGVDTPQNNLAKSVYLYNQAANAFFGN